MAVSDKTRKLLWGRAGNRCAICGQELTRAPKGTSSHTVLGDEAHLVARSTSGPRGGLDPPGGDLDGYANLILLCANDHRLIDDQPEVYPLTRLVALKEDHEQWVAETLEGGRTSSAARRSECLDRLRRESLARCIDGWQAIGLPLDDAKNLAADPDIGARAELGEAAQAVIVLVGDVGSGKSLAGERRHQAAIERNIADPNAPVPVWLRAREVRQGLEQAVADALRTLGSDPQGTAVHLTVDGLDEAGPAAAGALLSDVRRFVHARDGSQAVLTTRLLEAVGNDDERVVLPPLSEEDAIALIAHVSGNRNFSLWSYATSVREAVRRPLFAIALGRLLFDEPTYAPATPAELIDRIVGVAVGNAWQELRGALVELAVAVLRRGGGSVRTAEVVPAHRLEALLATRLVVEERGRIRFPLIVFAQWFAAEGVLGNDIEVDSLLDVPRDLELWRYPLAIAVARGSEAQATGILSVLARRNPAFASIVVSESVRQYGAQEDAYPGTWQEAGGAVLDAARAWTHGLGPLAKLVAPLHDGDLVALGVRIDESERLSTAWYRGSEHGDDQLFELDRGFFPLSAPRGFGPARSGPLPGGPAWSWRWVRDELADSLGQLLANRALVLGGTPLEHEAVWTVALRALGRSPHVPGPLDVRPLLEMDPGTNMYVAPSRISSALPPSIVPVKGLRMLLDQYVDENGMMSPPWPGPDQQTSGSWVWSDFTAERVRERAEAIFSAALRCYDHFADTLFASLSVRMRVAVTSPVVARGSVMFTDRQDYEGAPMLFWHLEPLPPGSASCAEFVLGERPTHSLEERRNELRSARPEAARWISAFSFSSALDVFGVAPAAQYMYQWLWDDLKAVGWVKGLVSAGWPRDVLPPLA